MIPPLVHGFELDRAYDPTQLTAISVCAEAIHERTRAMQDAATDRLMDLIDDIELAIRFEGGDSARVVPALVVARAS